MNKQPLLISEENHLLITQARVLYNQDHKILAHVLMNQHDSNIVTKHGIDNLWTAIKEGYVTYRLCP